MDSETLKTHAIEALIRKCLFDCTEHATLIMGNEYPKIVFLSSTTSFNDVPLH